MGGSSEVQKPLSKVVSSHGKVSDLATQNERGKKPRIEIDGQLVGRIIGNLVEIMDEVVSEEATPQTVHAACACADKIAKFLRLELDTKKLNAQIDGDVV